MQDIMSFNQKEPRQDIWAHYDPKKAIEGYGKALALSKALTATGCKERSGSNADRTVKDDLPNVCRI